MAVQCSFLISNEIFKFLNYFAFGLQSPIGFRCLISHPLFSDRTMIENIIWSAFEIFMQTVLHKDSLCIL